jgi:hypothetical protein
MSKIDQLLPFMEGEDLKDLAMKIARKEIEGVKLHKMYPFLGEKDLNEVIDLLIENKDASNLKKAIPFMTNEKMDQLFEAVQKNEIEDLPEHYFYPFLSKDKIKSLFETYVDELKNQEPKES